VGPRAGLDAVHPSHLLHRKISQHRDLTRLCSADMNSGTVLMYCEINDGVAHTVDITSIIFTQYIEYNKL
jgi:hypothetical protein